MIRLVFSDLRDHAATWIGAFAIAVVCGYIGGWVVSLQATAGFQTDALQKFLQNAASSVLMFSLIAAVAVLVSAANLTVSAQRRSYALWQLANVEPRLVSAVVLAQLAVVAVLGAMGGTLLAAVTFEPLFPLVLGSREALAQVAPVVDATRLPAVWAVAAAVFLLGGMKGARSAGRTPPLIVLREPEPRRARVTWLRTLLFAGMLACTCWASLTLTESPDVAMSWSVFVPILVVATLVPLAPLIFSALLDAWTPLVPQSRWNAWYLARRIARHGLSSSTSIETPIMVGFGLVAGLFSAMACSVDYLERQGVADISTLGLAESFVMLAGPVLLCVFGAAVSVAMSSRSRTRDVALLVAGGAKPATLMAAAGCEALIHAVTATMVGAAAVVASNAVVANAFGVPLFANLAFGEGLVVSLAGFALVLAATLAPTWAALNREAAAVLSAGE
ncbi:ABC transporter permease [Gordonibacter sp. 28C]|uniref:FtsX-like permease family protein n=1 Tax=Gordonibacter sp. 28C TaxID=2078569 RepID=UPI000DF757F8|nr:FtsX-like permease family protein [Gordonibacter sp. 28C]RDB61797.1 ABC transporter permease [Gordonibacter sp. 28C]